MTETPDPVEYTVIVRHWAEGGVDVTIKDVGSSEEDRKAVAYALREAADLVESGQLTETQ